MDDPAFTILNDEHGEDVVDVTSALEPVEQ